MARKQREVESWYQAPIVPVCPLCGREIPPSQIDAHHLVPKLKGGKETCNLHRICHRQIHALFTETELAQKYNHIEALLSFSEVQKFVQWVKTKPNEFSDSVKMSKRKK